MNEHNLNRFDYLLLNTLFNAGCRSYFKSMTIKEIMDYNKKCTVRARMTIYKKLQKLVRASYINKGILDNHADTYHLTEKGIKLIEEIAE